MRSLFAIVALMCICQMDARKCKREDRMKMKEMAKKITEAGEAPECFETHDIKRFHATNREERREMKAEFKKWMKEKSEDEKKEILSCFLEMGTQIMEKLKEEGTEISEECKNKFKKVSAKMLSYINGEKEDAGGEEEKEEEEEEEGEEDE
ncbi:uncharacterized protein PF3D7_1120000 [Parasteatoda tepidariorum]|uniref:uncharacterized protein PF3D7_1120000 n=1 Tax=Parasteatoda tepidariorum TaxID=114398 RepID=UPI001C7282F8|nr:protein FAM50A [Parasteatoda tepidariorum]